MTAPEIVPLMNEAGESIDAAPLTSAAALLAETPGVISYALPQQTFVQDKSFGTDLPHADRKSRLVHQRLLPQYECQDKFVSHLAASSVLCLLLATGTCWAVRRHLRQRRPPSLARLL